MKRARTIDEDPPRERNGGWRRTDPIGNEDVFWKVLRDGRFCMVVFHEGLIMGAAVENTLPLARRSLERKMEAQKCSSPG